MSLQLPTLFSDHMVFQRSSSAPVWGWAAPGEQITVTLANHKASCTTDAGGRWLAELNLEKGGEGPFILTVTGSRGDSVTVADVLVGEVWLASGQSNMEWPMSKALTAECEIPRSANSRLREFFAEQTSRAEPQRDVKGKWAVAAPDTTPAFSAVGYHFAKMLQEKLNCPVAIIHSSWGGSRLESWISPDALNEEESGRAKSQHAQLAAIDSSRRDYIANYRAWEERHGRKDPGSPNPEKFNAPGVSEEGWTPVTLPGKLAQYGLPDAGVIWLRRKVRIPAAYAKPGMHIHIDVFREFEALYVNGELVRETTCESPHQLLNASRCFHMPIHLAEGESTFAIRLFSPAGGAEISGGSFWIEGAVETAGQWLAKNEHAMTPPDAAALDEMPQPPSPPPPLQNIPGALYNGMIAPLIPYSIAGVIWYQGESNIAEAALYEDGFRRMIDDWRARWKLPTLPVYYCQLPDKGDKTKEPPSSPWARFREVQACSMDWPHTGMAVLIGLGDALDIHPRNKKDVGERLARLALARTYGQKIPADSPRFAGMKIENGRAKIQFRHAEGGLAAHPFPPEHVLRYEPDFTPVLAPLPIPSRGSELQGFVICGADGNWKWAQAKLAGADSVEVWSGDVPDPVAVRYAWADNPTCNLFNKAGLPAIPFRTDDFPL